MASPSINYVTYGTDDRDVRVQCNCVAHDADSNKYAPSSVYQKLDIITTALKRVTDSNYDAAQKQLLSVCYPGPARMPLLGGSWDFVNGVTSTSIGVISKYNCSYLRYNPNY